MVKAQLLRGDCLELLPGIPDQSVDFILADPPYGTTDCIWDSVIPFQPMWEQLRRIIKYDGAIALFCSQPFTSALVMSNVAMFKYCWIWEKNISTGFLQARYRPLKDYEDIAVFSFGGATSGCSKPMKFRPQGISLLGIPRRRSGKKPGALVRVPLAPSEEMVIEGNYPSLTLRYASERGLHPTQKPVSLGRYLVRT